MEFKEVKRTISISKRSTGLIEKIRKGLYEATGELFKNSEIMEEALDAFDKSLQRKAKREAAQEN